MPLHRNITTESELHTPKGTDSATANQILVANGDGTTGFTELLHPCGTGYTTTGVWDYSVDGFDSDTYITFTGLEDYVYLELETHDLVSASPDAGFLQVGNDSGWNGVWYSFYHTIAFSAAEVGEHTRTNVARSNAAGDSCGITRIYNFNIERGTVAESTGYYPDLTADTTYALMIERSETAWNKLRIDGLENITAGKVYLKGIKG